MKKKLYVALDDASWPRITTDARWIDRREITEDEALEHITPDGLEAVYAGREATFTDRDQSAPALYAMFAE